MFDGRSLTVQYEALPRGTRRLMCIQSAIAKADQEKALYWQLEFRYDAVMEAAFYDDPHKAFPLCMEYIALFDQHPEHKLQPVGLLFILQAVINSCVDLPQIPLSQCEELFEEYKRRCLAYGVNLRTYYQQAVQFLRYIDMDRAARAFEQFEQTVRDFFSDCEACEQNTRVWFTLQQGDLDRALILARPILDGSLTCHEVPHSVYRTLLEYRLQRGELSQVAQLSEQLYPLIRQNRNYLSYVGVVIWAMGLTNPDEGVTLFQRHLPWAVSAINLRDQYEFYKGAWVLFTRLEQAGRTQLSLVLNQGFPLYQQDGIYSTKALAEYAEARCREIAARFDARNQTDYFTQGLESAFPSN